MVIKKTNIGRFSLEREGERKRGEERVRYLFMQTQHTSVENRSPVVIVINRISCNTSNEIIVMRERIFRLCKPSQKESSRSARGNKTKKNSTEFICPFCSAHRVPYPKKDHSDIDHSHRGEAYLSKLEVRFPLKDTKKQIV